MSTLSNSYQLLVTPQTADRSFQEPSSAANKSLPIHRWTNWIAGFSGEFASSTIDRYLPSPQSDSIILDPFAGVGTTLVEAYRKGITSIGFEINPFAALVCKVKLASLSIDPGALMEAAGRYELFMGKVENGHGSALNRANDTNVTLPKNSSPSGFKSRIPFFSPNVERKVLFTLDFLEDLPLQIQEIFRVALASVLVEFSNYSYEPSLSTRPAAGKALVLDASVGKVVSAKVSEMATDINSLQIEMANTGTHAESNLHCASFFEAEQYVNPSTVDLVVTSPPYMNNYHYVRNTRPQLFWINLVSSSTELKVLEEINFGKFWQTVRGREPVPLNFRLPSLESQIGEISQLNPEKGVYGGSGWGNYVTSYMNDLYRFCGLLSSTLRPNGIAAIVIGNSVIQGKEIAVEEYLSKIAGLQNLVTIDVVKVRNRVGSSIVNTGARISGKSKPTLYDAVVILRRSS